MLRHKPVSFLMVGSALVSALCVTLNARSGQAQPTSDGAAGVTSPPLPPPPPSSPDTEVTEGPAQPELQATRPERAAPTTIGSPPHVTGWLPRPTRAAVPYGDAERSGPTDHQRVIGRWGIEARRIDTLKASKSSPDPRCQGVDDSCRNVQLTSIGVRRWISEHYAYSAGLAFAVGGGSTSGLGSWDTHFGIGPTVGAYFLLSQWKHLAISATPQLGLLYFAPSGSGSKTLSADVMGKVEAELHLGFIGLPGFAVGTDAGLGFKYTRVSNDSDGSGGYSVWNVGTAGTSTPWGLVTNAFLRFYL